MNPSFLSIALTLFLLIDPIGNVPIFIALLKELSPKQQRRVILRELLIALAIIIGFVFLGDPLLSLLGISAHTIMIAGGIILFLIALKMVFPSSKDAYLDGSKEKEPFIVPLAIPLIAGPAVLANIILYAGQTANNFLLIGAIVAAWLASTIILLSSSFLKNVLGMRGITACERLMGLILVLLAVQMFFEGLSRFFGQ